MPPVPELSEFRGVLLAGRHSPVPKDKGPGPLGLRVSKPHVNITVERAGGSHLEIRRPADPVDSISVGLPLVDSDHICRLEDNLILGFLIVGTRDEGPLGRLTHLLLLGNGFLLELLCIVMTTLFLLKLAQELSNIPLLHVAEFVTRPEHLLFVVVINSTDREVDDLPGWLSLCHSDLFILIYLADASQKGILDIAGRHSIKVQESIHIGRYNTVCFFKEFTDHNAWWIRFVRCQSSFQFFGLMIL